MAFQFKSATCVVAGTFNMYIVRPQWLAKIDILPKGIPVAISTKLDAPGFRFGSPKLSFGWLVTPNRLEVDTTKPDEDCGAKVATVLAALRETPLIALGNNALYRAPLSEAQSLTEDFQGSPQVPEGYECTQRSFHFALAKEGRVTNLQLSITKDELELSSNVHTELRDRESDAAQAAARRFLQDRHEAEALINQLFKVSIEYGDSNSNPA